MPVKKKKEEKKTPAQRLREHIARIQSDPQHDRQVVSALYERLGKMSAAREDEEDLINKLEKRNRVLRKIAGRD